MLGLGLHRGIGKSSGGDPNLLLKILGDSYDWVDIGTPGAGNTIIAPTGSNVPTGLTSCMRINSPDSAVLNRTLKVDGHLAEAYLTMYVNVEDIPEPSVSTRERFWQFGPFWGTDLVDTSFNLSDQTKTMMEIQFGSGGNIIEADQPRQTWFKLQYYWNTDTNVLEVYKDGVLKVTDTPDPIEAPKERSDRFSLGQSNRHWIVQVAGITIHRKKFVELF